MRARPRCTMLVVGLVVGLPYVVSLRADFLLHRAHAEVTKPTPLDYVRPDGAKKTVKPAKPMPATKPAAVPDCVRAAYAKLDEETTALLALHGGKTALFWDAYKARKQALVSQAALAASGCTTP